MKKIFILPVLSLLLYSCASGSYPKYPKDIPMETNKIYVHVKANPDSLYTFIAKTMGENRWLVNGSREAKQIQGDKRDIETGAYIKTLIKVKSISPDSSSALFMGTWSNRPFQQDFINYGIVAIKNRTKRITWKGPHEKYSNVFLALNRMATDVPNAKIEYSR